MVQISHKLREYRSKRDFEKTPEPQGPAPAIEAKRKFPIFVVQKHAARRLHYDFRLEADGVLKSWAVPKGPSMKEGEKRLAVQTEDHPRSYASFEGFIPKDQYGGGEVIVWDWGYYLHLTRHKGRALSFSEAMEKGKLVILLAGHKIKGLFGLYRMGSDEKSWLLIKRKDEHPYENEPVQTSPRSVLSGYTIEDLQKNPFLKFDRR